MKRNLSQRHDKNKDIDHFEVKNGGEKVILGFGFPDHPKCNFHKFLSIFYGGPLKNFSKFKKNRGISYGLPSRDGFLASLCFSLPEASMWPRGKCVSF